MAVVAADIKIRYSVGTGSAGNSTAGTRAGSLGKYMSTTDVSGSANVFFDDVNSTEASAGDTEYSCIFVYNSHSTDSALNVTAQIVSEVGGGGATTAALDNVATSSAGSASAQADGPVANENTAPSAVGTFDTSSKSIGTLAAGQCKAVWLKRTVSASTGAMTGDGFTFRVTFDG
jgi:hypothetical protein